MVSQANDNEEKPRVLAFRRRDGRRVPTGTLPPHGPVEDVGKYERAGDEVDDFRHRMIMNAAGLVVCGLLVLAGVWIANKIAEVRKDQDCVLSGRRNCAGIPYGIGAEPR